MALFSRYLKGNKEWCLIFFEKWDLKFQENECLHGTSDKQIESQQRATKFYLYFYFF